MANLFQFEAPLPSWTARPKAAKSAGSIVTAYRDLDEVRSIWRAVEETGSATVFQSWCVFQSWVRNIAKPQGINWLVIVVSNAVTGAPQMLLPLAVRHQGHMRIVEFADFGVSDFNAPLLAKGVRYSRDQMLRVWQKILEALPAGDLLSLSKVPADIVGQANPLLLLPGLRKSQLAAYGTPLGATWPEWSATLDAKFLKDIEARCRKLEKRGKVEFKVVADKDAAAPRFAAMCQQRAARHTALKRPNILARSGYADFYHDLFSGDEDGGVAHIASLSIDGEIIATGYGLAYGASFHMIFPTFKAETWRNYSPGLQLFVRSMRWAIENGFTYYDFTIGSEGFKRDLGAEQRPLYEKLVALSPRGVPDVMASRVKHLVRSSPEAASRAMSLIGFPIIGAT